MMLENVTQSMWTQIGFKQRFSSVFTFVRYSRIISIKRITMPKNMQNLVVLIEIYHEDDNGYPWYKEDYEISSKGGNMCLNRFCVDEDAAFELSGVYYFDILYKYNPYKGKGYLSFKEMISACL